MRSSTITAASLLCLLSASTTALAQPVEVNQYPVPAPPVVVAVPCLAAAAPGRDPCLEQLLDSDPRYQAAKRKRNTGIVLTSVGGAVGILVATVAWASYMARDVGSSVCWGASCVSSHNDYTGEKIAGIAGATLFVISMAVGIPTIVSGSREMRFIRAQHLGLVPFPVVSAGPGRASFGATWRF